MRRVRRGCRPSIKGAGPWGRNRGDQEQWIFKDVVMEQWEKDMVVAEVVASAIKAMFENHY